MMVTHSEIELLILLTELPDPFQQLAIQLGKDLDIFTKFTELPTELRLKIWREAFPKGRYVCLGGGSGDLEEWAHPYGGNRNQKGALRLLYRLHPPITLSINGESRKESLQYYCVILWSGRLPANPLCFNHGLDTAYLPARLLSNEMYVCWHPHLAIAAPKILGSIHYLEIRDYEWTSYSKGTLFPKLSMGPNIIPFGKPLLEFSALKGLHFVLHRTHGAGDVRRIDAPSRMDGKEEILEQMSLWLEAHKENWGGIVPEVTVENWSKLPA